MTRERHNGDIYLAGSKRYAVGKRKTKAQADREQRQEAKREEDKAQAEWVMAHMSDEINKLRKRGR